MNATFDDVYTVVVDSENMVDCDNYDVTGNHTEDVKVLKDLIYEENFVRGVVKTGNKGKLDTDGVHFSKEYWMKFSGEDPRESLTDEIVVLDQSGVKETENDIYDVISDRSNVVEIDTKGLNKEVNESYFKGADDESEGITGSDTAANSTDNGSSAAVIGIESSCNKLAKNLDDSFVMDNLLIHQNSCSITEYVEDFMHIKFRAEFIFKCDIEDHLLAYCFVVGLKEDIREALELWSPRTLREAIYLAKVQESMLKENMWVENVEMKSDKGLEELELQVETRVNTSTNGVTGEIQRDENLNILAAVNDLQKQTTKNVSVVSSLNVMQISNQARASTNANDMHKRYENVCKRNMHNFDPGGGMIPASIFSIEDGILELVLKVHVISSTNANFSAIYVHLLELQFPVLKTFATAFIPPCFSSRENAFCGYHKVMEVGIKVCNKEKRKNMLKGRDGEREGTTENDFEISSSLKLVFKNGDTKWYDKGEENRVMEFGMGVNEEFSGWARVGMTYGAAAWNATPGTATTIFLHKLQQCILSWVFLKVVRVVKDTHLAFRKEHGYGVNHGLRSFDDLDEVSRLVGLEMTCSCVAKYFKVMPINRKPKWHLKLLDEAKFLKKISVGSSINSNLVGLPWKHIVSEHFDWERFSESLNMILKMHLNYMNSSEASFTSTLSAHVYFSSLGASKHCVVIEELIVYTTSAVFASKSLRHTNRTEVQKLKDMLGRCKAHGKVSSATNHGSDVKLVFDPGGCDCWLQRYFQESHILEDKDILRGMDCNGPGMYMGMLLFHLGRLIDKRLQARSTPTICWLYISDSGQQENYRR